jgi:hypothetical protein
MSLARAFSPTLSDQIQRCYDLGKAREHGRFSATGLMSIARGTPVKAPAQLIAIIESLGTAASALRFIEGFGNHLCWAINCPGTDSLRSWQHLRDRVNETGFWPVIVSGYMGPDCGGSDATIEQLLDNSGDGEEISDEEKAQPGGTSQSTTKIIEEAQALPFEQWVKQERDPDFQIAKHLKEAERFAGMEGASGLAEVHRNLAAFWREQPNDKFDADSYRLPPEINSNPPQQELHCLKWYESDLSEVVADSVAILFVPTRFSWEVPAFLSYTTREGERPPSVHVAALKWLSDRFGADLVGIDTRILEVIPRKRPLGKEEALHAADSLRAYSSCPETSQNEMASLEELAFYLVESKYWSFCWP